MKLAAISYDSDEILKFFAERHKIEYPLLGDPESKIIAEYGVLNKEATGMQRGFARPGYFFIDRNGIIREKYFDPRYRERLTGNSLIGKLFPELGQEVTATVDAPHLQVALEQSDTTGVPGRESRWWRRCGYRRMCTFMRRGRRVISRFNWCWTRLRE